MRTAVVIAGAVARGAYEAGALAEILERKLSKEDLRETLFLGTSAGAINAVLWGGLADGRRSIREIGELVCNVWRELEDTEVFAPLHSVVEALHGLLSGSGAPLLDTGPLKHTVKRYFERLTLTANLAQGHVGGVAVAATFCGSSAAGARTDVFYQGRGPSRAPSEEGALQYFPTELASKHVLASSAVPVLFEPVSIDGAYYVDGGVRLNTPIAPAIDFGAERIIVISSHATRHPQRYPLEQRPAGIDTLAMILHSMLADGTIEDLRRVRRINQLLTHPGIETSRLRRIELIEVSPPAGQLAKLARAALDDAKAAQRLRDPRSILRAQRYELLEALFARLGTSVGLDEMMSYVLFDPRYFEAQIKLGRKRAREAADWSYDRPPS